MSAREKFDPAKADIERVSMEVYGNVTAIAKHYGVSRYTVYQYLHRQEEGLDLLRRTHAYNTEIDMDLAELTYRYAMQNLKSDLKSALKAADKVIEMKGQRRGWQRQLIDSKHACEITHVHGTSDGSA